DRFKVRADIKQRLTESFETALRLSDGLALVAPHNSPDPTTDIAFSARMACPHCGYSLEDLEPRLFSFNSPSGACPSCDGLGMLQV
ncbi:hypothetical protein, partial [Staphylococcus aureus]